VLTQLRPCNGSGLALRERDDLSWKGVHCSPPASA
jgi:hypothetical protein